MAKKNNWHLVNIKYWTDEPEETIKKALIGINDASYKHKVAEVEVYINGSLKLKKPWWKFWSSEVTK